MFSLSKESFCALFPRFCDTEFRLETQGQYQISCNYVSFTFMCFVFLSYECRSHLFGAFCYSLCLEWFPAYRKHFIINKCIFQLYSYQAITFMLFPNNEYGENLFVQSSKIRWQKDVLFIFCPLHFRHGGRPIIFLNNMKFNYHNCPIECSHLQIRKH